MSIVYTPEKIAEMKAASPLNLEKAKELASKFGGSHQSVIVKARILGIDYESKSKESKKVKSTKKELTARLRTRAGLPDRAGDLTVADLWKLCKILEC